MAKRSSFIKASCLLLLIAIAIGVGNTSADVTEQPRLDQNYPNPFSQATEIVFSIPSSGHVTLRVYNMLGKELEEVLDEKMDRGEYRRRFDGTRLPTGQYSYTMTYKADDGSPLVKLTKRMFLVR